MAKLVANLSANDDPVLVSLDAPLGSLGDGPGGVLTIGSEGLVVVDGAGTDNILADRGATPAVHAVGATATYAAPNFSVTTPGLSDVVAINADPGATFLTVGSAAPTTFVTFLVFDDTATSGGLYAWDGSAYRKVGLATT